VQGPCYSDSSRALDIIILDTPRGGLIDVSSSSYGLSLFSLKAGPHPDEGVVGAPGESSSVSVGELRPGFDVLDEVGLEGTSTVLAQNPPRYQMSRSCTNPQGSRRKGEGGLCVD
jgi:hypothetical protein